MIKKKVFYITIISIFILWIITILGGNNSFLKNYYHYHDVKIPVPYFSFHKDDIKSSHQSAHFYSLKSTNSIRDFMGNYLDGLQSCYDEGYFYDKDNNITIYKYNVEDKSLFNEIYIEYEYGNICESEFELDSEWIYEFLDSSVITEVVHSDTEKIIENDTIKEKLINFLISEHTRVKNNKRLDTNNYTYLVKIFYSIDDNAYELSILDYEENIAFVVVDANDHQKNAIYKIDDVNEFLKTL